MSKDDLGTRMKQNFELRTRIQLPRRTHLMLRIDGKAFHNYTRHCERPFDAVLAADMDAAACALCDEAQGACLAYVQSDEISMVLTDFEKPDTEAWFDNELQKIVSIAASTVTAHFNARRASAVVGGGGALPCFDCRAFTIPDRTEVANCFVWRQLDATRNSIQMAAQAHFSPKQLHGKSCNELQEMLWQAGTNWNDYPEGFKRGRVVERFVEPRDVEYIDKRTGQTCRVEGVLRAEWRASPAPIFTQNRGWLLARIPRHTREEDEAP